MAGWKDPVGPKDKNVYVRRRILVLLGLLAIVAAVVLIIVKPGSTGGATSSREVEVPEDLVASEQADAERESVDVAACGAGQLVVTPVTDRESYAAGELPQLSLSIENIGDASCTADLGTAGMTFRITSGSDEVWRSVDCQEGADHRAIILEPGVALPTEAISWDRTRSSPETCDISRDEVSADGASYHLHVSAAGVEGKGTAQFLLY
ncbi:MAG: hypothetical protein AB7V10_05065 [Leucobacter sp.]